LWQKNVVVKKKESIYIIEKGSQAFLLEMIGYGPAAQGVAIQVLLSTAL